MKRTVKRPFRRKYVSSAWLRPHPGSSPGLLRPNPMHVPSQVFVMGYGPDGYIEQACKSLDEIKPILSAWPVVWVDVIGLGSVEVVEQLGDMFGLERLLLEDVLDTSHRAKVEFHEQYVFTIAKTGMFAEQFETEQISIFQKKNVVISFEEKPGHSFEQVRERIRRGTGKIRLSGTDYLHYALLDEVIDKYFPILDRMNRQLAALEDSIVKTAGKDVIEKIHHTKSDLLLLHRTIWPVSDIISMMMREDSPLITKPTRNYLKDCYDHSIQVNELAQFYRDTAMGLMNTFLAYEGHKTNEIIKILTMVSAVFIPLNFIAGVYGMNFHHMPELDWKYGYLLALSLMVGVAVVMLGYFRRRGWIGVISKQDDAARQPEGHA